MAKKNRGGDSSGRGTVASWGGPENRRSLQHRPLSAVAKKRWRVPVPDRVSSDIIALFSDEALYDRLRTYETERATVVSSEGDWSSDSTPWEVELAYLRRESSLRATRHELHLKYCGTLDEDGDPLPPQSPPAALGAPVEGDR